MAGAKHTRSTLSGPATGGSLVFSLYQKRDASTTKAVEARVEVPLPVLVISAHGHRAAAIDGLNISDGTTDFITDSAAATGTGYVITNEGKASSLVSTTGIAFLEASRAARSVARGGRLELAVDGIGAGAPVAFAVSAHVVCAAQGHRYAVDPTKTVNQLYDVPND